MGAPFKYTANELSSLFEQYKIQFKENVLFKPEMIKSGERTGEIVNVPQFAIPEKVDFCLFIDVARSTFDYWISEECEQINKDLHYIASRVNDFIQSYQTKAGLVGLANPMLVSRINNISETMNINNLGEQQQINISIDGKLMDLKK